ncbi:helix-turn-helix domain-containing protein [Marinicellulosiphila megalodicopiae]|uniref:helix-turn-helix domain-containing protein n=1 Tax=Marinicellulosiphila megalodicopiae TaxID=2724896 RepID=UPI003BAED779
MTQSEQPLNIKQAAEFLDVSEITLKRYARENLIPSIKKGKDLLFEIKAVENYKQIADRLNGNIH